MQGWLEGKRKATSLHRATLKTCLESEEGLSETRRDAGFTVTAVQRASIDANRVWVPKGLGMIRRLTNGSAWALTKGVASCDKLRVGARSLRSGDTRMGLPVADNTCATPKWEEEPPERKHPSRRRKRNQEWDSQISGERNGKSPNRTLTGNCRGM